MTESSSVLIAAGGTAGHVLPSLAVAEELLARGARVTFAGSPDRLEARLVPEAGFEFHPYEVSGLPRRPSLELVRALVTDAKAMRAAGRIVRDAQPDVVFGGGGYVAGPIVAAAARQRIPPRCSSRTRTSGSRTGSQPRSPGASSSRSRSRVATAASTASPGGRFRAARSRRPRRRRARSSGSRSTGRCCSCSAGAREHARSTSSSSRASARSAPQSCTSPASATSTRCAKRVTRDDYRLVPFTNEVGSAYAAADLVLARAGGSVWELAAAGKPAVLVPYPFATADHQSKNAALLRPRRRRRLRSGDRPRPRAGAPALADRRSRSARAHVRGDAPRCPPERGRGDRGGAA